MTDTQKPGPLEKRVMKFVKAMFIDDLTIKMDWGNFEVKMFDLIQSLYRFDDLFTVAEDLERLMQSVLLATSKSDAKNALQRLTEVLNLAPQGVNDAVGELVAKPTLMMIEEANSACNSIRNLLDQYTAVPFKRTVTVQVTIQGSISEKMLDGHVAEVKFLKVEPIAAVDVHL